MKKQFTKSLFLAMTFIAFGMVKMYAQEEKYQLRNSNFDEPFVTAPGSGSTGTEPQFWHSFNSCTGSLASTARTTAQLSQSTDTRNGVGYSARINARLVLIVVANGNLTTGRVNAGNMTASNPANHNFTDPNDDNFNEPWTATPDSMRFWAKYTTVNAGQYARMSTYIHDDFRFTDPLAGNANSADNIVGFAECEWQRGDQGWHQYTVPFDYASYTHLGKSPKYILVTFSTKREPGGGDRNDALLIDDIEMVYSAWLTDLKVNGQTIAGFEKGLLTYGGPRLTGEPGSYAFPYQPEDISWTSESNYIRGVEVTNVLGPDGDADGGYTSIVVTAQDGGTKEYKIMYSSALSDDNSLAALGYTIDGENTVMVPNFSPTVLSYDIFITDAEEINVPQIVEESIVLSDENAEIFEINQPTNVNSAGTVTVRAQNLALKVYTLNFTKAVSTNSELSWIKIGGIDVENFDAETLSYNFEIATCVSANNQFPTVTFEKASYWANVVYTAATTATRTATIAVTAEDGTTTTYTVNFVLTNDNTELLGYRVNTTARNNAFTAANNYVDTYSASFTTAPTLQASTTAAQQSCGNTAFPTIETFVWYPDTNKIVVTAQNGIATQTYGAVIKNTNSYLTTGTTNVGLKYRYNGITYNVNVPSSSNNNATNISAITLPVGPNEPAVLFDANPQAPSVDSIVYTQPTSRAGTASVRVFARDGNTSKIYNLTFNQTISNVATLNNITYNNGANQVLGFNPAQENYTVLITSNITEVPQFVGIPTFEWLPEGNIVYQQAQTFQEAATITVTAENGTTVKTYTINFEVVEPQNDAYALMLKYDGVDVPNFNPAVFEYTVNIPYTATTPTLSAITTSPTAMPFYVQPTDNSLVGRVLVFSQNMTTSKAYTVNFVKELSPETAIDFIKYEYNNQLYTYVVTGGETEIIIVLPAETEGEPTITEIILLDNRSAVQVEEPSEANNFTATAIVTAEDGTEETYSIAFVRTLSGSTLLTEIRYNGILLEDFNPNMLEYTVVLPLDVFPTEITATPTWINTDVQIIWLELPAIYSNILAMAQIIVTSENGENTITYTVSFERELEKSDNANLASILVDGNSIADFDADVTEYSVMLPKNYFGMPIVTAVAQDVNATVVINSFTQVNNKVFIIVTAENEEVVKTYEVTFSYDPTVDISEVVADNFTFYPNPVLDVLNVETGANGQVTLRISDNNGRVVLMKTVAEAAKIDVSNLPSGIYTISVDGVFGGKFVKL